MLWKRLDLVDVLKKDQKSFGLEGRLLLREAKKFSRLSLISLFEVRRRFLYFSNRTTGFLRRTFRRVVSFFLMSEIIAGVIQDGSYLPFTIFLGICSSAISRKVSLHKFQSSLMSDALLELVNSKSMFIKLRFISSKFARL